ncbi:hypothetical protein A7D00_1374 [Trichophyton violaceum]|uniref:RRM domain-containing protein n=1 Tax=Trichophyton violaceum TaxID=34388 RepID=A0A178FMN2_TRIVO|nr:hypothetical protein A7D00_1374 [Trichophyton violaceum]
MSLPPPPGLQRPLPSQAASQAQPPASLPARPPSTASAYTAPSTSSTTPSTVSRPPSLGPDVSRPAVGAAFGFQPRVVAAQSYRASQAPAYPTVYSAGYQYPQPQHQHQPPPHHHQQQHQQQQQTYQAQPTSYYGQSQSQAQRPYNATTYGQHHAYQKRNNTGSYGARSGQSRYNESSGDPEMDAQIAQWQSAYMSKDSSEAAAGTAAASGPAATGANSGPIGSFQRLHDPSSSTSTPPNGTGSGTAASTTPIPGANQGLAAVPGQESTEPAKTVVRSGGGQTWTDSTLLEWDPAHFRLFCGNLAGEVTDDSLLKAFSKYPSVQKARVIRDKRTEKSKGYGFVSFSDGDDYFKAAREMQGKYIGSHPVLLRRAMTEIRPVSASKGKHLKGKGKHGHHHSGSGHSKPSSTPAPVSSSAGKTDSGVKKQKTKGGLRVLG